MPLIIAGQWSSNSKENSLELNAVDVVGLSAMFFSLPIAILVPAIDFAFPPVMVGVVGEECCVEENDSVNG